MVFQSPGPILCQLGPLTVRWYGVMIAAGFMLTVFAAVKMCKARGLDGDKLINLSLICFISGVLGARLYYAALNPSYFLIHPGEILATWKGGLSIHGGLIGGIIAAYIFLKREKLPLYRWHRQWDAGATFSIPRPLAIRLTTTSSLNYLFRLIQDRWSTALSTTSTQHFSTKAFGILGSFSCFILVSLPMLRDILE